MILPSQGIGGTPPMMPHYQERLQHWQDDGRLGPYVSDLQQRVHERLASHRQGDFPRWFATYQNLPSVPVQSVEFDKRAITVSGDIDPAGQQLLRQRLMELHPWRKGPFDLFGVFIDSEWQSWMKWDRLAPHLPDLAGKRVLDIGCGNGYYLMRMAAQRPRALLGADPGLMQMMQFWTVEKYASSGACVLPLAMQDLPKRMPVFDLVLSMGVFYHRKDPVGHLLGLKEYLAPGGQVILETLVVEGDANTCLMPPGRYAQMRNVWFLPSVAWLTNLLQKVGFQAVRCLDESATGFTEQRQTEWMRFHSLPQFLNADGTQTREGLPPPRRAIFAMTL